MISQKVHISINCLDSCFRRNDSNFDFLRFCRDCGEKIWKPCFSRFEKRKKLERALLLTIVLAVLTTIAGCSKEPPETKAVRLAKESNALKDDKPVELVIKDLMQERKSDFKPMGWKIEQKSEKIFLVSYRYKIHSFRDGVGERGFFFEVDLSNDSVRNVTKEYVSKMKPLSPVYNEEKQLVDEFMSKKPLVE